MLVFVLSARVQTLQPSTATGIFFAYAVLNGLNLSSIFLVYDFGSLILAFLVGAVYFGVMAVYGNVTNRDLTGWGPKLMGGLVALIVCSLVGGLFSLFGFGFGIIQVDFRCSHQRPIGGTFSGSGMIFGTYKFDRSVAAISS